MPTECPTPGVGHDKLLLSIVIPLLNEEEMLEHTYAELKKCLDEMAISYELVFVDDGSTDRSRTILRSEERRVGKECRL